MMDIKLQVFEKSDAFSSFWNADCYPKESGS